MQKGAGERQSSGSGVQRRFSSFLTAPAISACPSGERSASITAFWTMSWNALLFSSAENTALSPWPPEEAVTAGRAGAAGLAGRTGWSGSSEKELLLSLIHI